MSNKRQADLFDLRRIGRLLLQAAEENDLYLCTLSRTYVPRYPFNVIAMYLCLVLMVVISVACVTGWHDPRFMRSVFATAVLDLLLGWIFFVERRDFRRLLKRGWELCRGDPRWVQVQAIAALLKEWEQVLEPLAKAALQASAIGSPEAIFDYGQLRAYNHQLAVLVNITSGLIEFAPLGHRLLPVDENPGVEGYEDGALALVHTARERIEKEYREVLQLRALLPDRYALPPL